MAPAGSRAIQAALQASAKPADAIVATSGASESSAAPSNAVVSTPSKTLVQKALESSSQKKRASNHRRTADQIVNKVIYDNFRSWNALQTDGIRIAGMTLRERLLDDRRKVVV